MNLSRLPNSRVSWPTAWLVLAFLGCAGPRAEAPAAQPATTSSPSAAPVAPAADQQPAEELESGYRFADGTWSGWVPLKPAAQPFVRGQLNGQEVDILLDTGAGITVVDKRLAERIGLRGQGEGAAVGTGGKSQPVTWVSNLEVRVGGLLMRGLPGAIVDMGEARKLSGKELPLILGTQVFWALIADFDFPNQRMAFREPKQFRYQGQGASLPVTRLEGNLVGVPLTVEEQAPAVFLLDTGNNGACDMFTEQAKRIGLFDERPTSTAVIGSVGGISPARQTMLAHATFAGRRFREIPISVFATAHEEWKAGKLGGILGTELLRRFRLVLDYANGRVIAELADGQDTRPFAKDRSGLLLRPDGEALMVVHVAAGSPAEQAGWKAGDSVVTVDGSPVAPRAPELASWRYRPAGTRVTLTDRAGQTRALVLADYF